MQFDHHERTLSVTITPDSVAQKRRGKKKLHRLQPPISPCRRTNPNPNANPSPKLQPIQEMDAKDILGLTKNSFPSSQEKKPRPPKESQRKPDGVSREVYALTGGNLPPIMPTVDLSHFKRRPPNPETKEKVEIPNPSPAKISLVPFLTIFIFQATADHMAVASLYFISSDRQFTAPPLGMQSSFRLSSESLRYIGQSFNFASLHVALCRLGL